MYRIIALLIIALLTSTLAAQNFDGQVTQDPKAGLAIYDFHFSGPPNGHAILFTSLGLGPFPIQIGQIGPLYLDPFFFPVSPYLQLDRNGQGHYPMALPMSLTQDLTFCFQALFIDPNLMLRVPNQWVAAAQGAMKKPTHDVSYAIGYDLNSATVDFAGHGKPGTSLLLQIFDDKNRLVDTIKAPIGKDGKSGTQQKLLKQNVKKGYSWKVWEVEGNTSVLIATGKF